MAKYRPSAGLSIAFVAFLVLSVVWIAARFSGDETPEAPHSDLPMEMIDSSTYSPLVMHEYAAPDCTIMYSLSLVANDLFAESNPTFEAAGYYANGQGWESLVWFYLKETDPMLAEDMFLNSEGEVMLLEFRSRVQLQSAAKAIYPLISSRELQELWLAKVPPEQMQ